MQPSAVYSGGGDRLRVVAAVIRGGAGAAAGANEMSGSLGLAAISHGETTGAVIAALALATLVVLVVARIVSSSGRKADARMTALVAELERRTTDIRDELVEALAREREESKRSRLIGELTSSIDLDEVLKRTLDAATGLPGVDGAHVGVIAPTGDTVVRSVGLTEEELEEVQLGPASIGSRVRSLALSFEHGTRERAVEAALVIPLRTTDTVGLLTLFSRTPDYVFSRTEVADAEDLAVRVAPALENACRFYEARRLADIDSHTGLHNRRYFHETLARESARSQRYERPLALIVFDLDDFKEINDRLGHLAGDAVLGQIGERLRGVVRSSDIACRVGGDEFGVILPESTAGDAELLCERLKSHLTMRPIPQAGRLQISAGIAELRSQDDAVTLFERADDALYRAKEAGKGRVVLATTVIGRVPDAPPSAISRIEREEG